MDNFGQCFRAFLKRNSYAQTDVAARLGFSQGQISRLCNQAHIPRPHVLAHLALKLGVTEAELLGKAPASSVVIRETGPLAVLHKRIAELELENRDLKRQLAAIQKVINKK